MVGRRDFGELMVSVLDAVEGARWGEACQRRGILLLGLRAGESALNIDDYPYEYCDQDGRCGDDGHDVWSTGIQV